jgi:heme exporter protein B
MLWKDLALELRTKESLSAMLVFGLLVLVIFNFSFGFTPNRSEMASMGGGLLWVAFTFAGILGLNRSFAAERENGCLQALLMTPVDRGALFLGKWGANLAFMLFAEAIILPTFGLIFNLPLGRFLPELILVIVLGTAGFTALGTLLAGVAANTRMKEVMLPILLFPVTIPLMLWAVGWTTALLQAGVVDSDVEPDPSKAQAVQLLAGFDLIFVTISYLLFAYVVED